MDEDSGRALKIWDVCDAIAACADYPDVLSLMYTSRAFFHSTIRHVWGKRPIAAQDLLKLLAGFDYLGVDNDAYCIKVNVPLPLPVGYFDRFSIYAPHVRELNYYLTEVPDFGTPWNNVDLFRQQLGSIVILPSLSRITLGIPGQTLCHILDLRLLELLVSPSLTHFTLAENPWVFNDRVSTRLYDFLNSKILANLHLKELSWFYVKEFPFSPDTIGRNLGRFHTFKTLSIPTYLSSFAFSTEILSVHLISWLSRLPNLEQLTIRTIQQSHHQAFEAAVHQEHSFSKLSILILENLYASVITGLHEVLRFSQLTELKCVIFASDEHPAQTLFDLTVKECPRLVKLTMAQSDRYGFDDMFFTPSEIKSGPAPNLVELSIHQMELRGTHPLSTITRLWPSLCRLDIREPWGIDLDLDNFLQLPTQLPKLEYLNAAVPELLQYREMLSVYDIEQMAKSGAKSALRLETNLWIVTHSVLSDEIGCDLIARFLSRWWPNMQLILPNDRIIVSALRNSWQNTYADINRSIIKYSSN